MARVHNLHDGIGRARFAGTASARGWGVKAGGEGKPYAHRGAAAAAAEAAATADLESVVSSGLGYTAILCYGGSQTARPGRPLRSYSANGP